MYEITLELFGCSVGKMNNFFVALLREGKIFGKKLFR
jgi:hypothetical protein